MNIKVRQQDISDCGAACLSSISKFYRQNIPIARIRQWAGTNKNGTTALGLIKAAKNMGFSAKGYEVKENALLEVPLPAIAHLLVKSAWQHYVVVTKITKTHIKIMDPSDGEFHRKTYEEFLKEWTRVIILVFPSPDFVPGHDKTSILARFIFLIKIHKTALIQALASATLYTLLGLAMAIYVQKITDFVLPTGNLNLLNLLSVIMLFVVLLQLLTGYFQSWLILRTGQLIDARLILGYYKHLLKLPQSFFDERRTGEIISRINDAVKIRAFINDSMISILINLFVILFSFVIMFVYSPHLALIIALIIPLYAILYGITDKLNKKRERCIMECTADFETQLVESINSIRTVKQLNIEEAQNLKTEIRFIRLLDSTYKSGLNSISSGNAAQFITRIFTIILLWAGGYQILKHSLTPGELFSLYALVGYLTGPAISLIGMNKTIQNAKIAADRLFDILDLEEEKNQEGLVELTCENVGDITFRNLTFSYNARTDVFEDLNLTIRKGFQTAIIGESGSGKSTIAALIKGLYEPNEGQIDIGGIDIRYLTRESLHRTVGIVPQSVELFAGTIIENIAVGEFTPDTEMIIKICHLIGIKEFTDNLPNGLNTVLGENGVNLSGGQRQKLAMARALYKQPEILILDEATSNLDPKSEGDIQSVVRKLVREGKTVIQIAHRLSAIRDSDDIIVLREGKVTERGRHNALVEAGGYYCEMWQRQSGPKTFIN